MLLPEEKIIFHIDMNSYFATCEQQANPHLRGKPLGICEHLGGIIIAASREAKILGIKTGTPVWEAKKIYPKIVLMPTDPEKYRATTDRFLKIFYSYTEKIEKYSIDEAYLDLTDDLKSLSEPWQEAEKIAFEIKKRIKKSCGNWISCSVGISYNKLLAKIASDMKKPDGLVIVRPQDKDLLYDQLTLTDIPGIARRTEHNLNLLGIKSLRDLRDYPKENLYAHFGIIGYHLHHMGKLESTWFGDKFSAENETIKSMGHAYTLPQATSEQKKILQVLYKLSEMVGRRLRDADLSGTTVYFVCSNKDGEFISKSKRLNYNTQDGEEIFLEAAKLFEQGNFSKMIRLVGVTVGSLKNSVNQQFLFERERRKQKLTNYLDKINNRYGEFTISRVPAWQARNVIRDSIGFGRMREFKVKYKRIKN